MLHVHCKCSKIFCEIFKTKNSLFRWFNWDLPVSRDYERLALNPSEENLRELENVGLLALCFNEEGSVLASGGEVCFLWVMYFSEAISEAVQ